MLDLRQTVGRRFSGAHYWATGVFLAARYRVQMRYTTLMAKSDTTVREAWRQHPWAIVLLILLAISFGGEIMLGARPLALIGSGMLLAGWTVQLIISLRRPKHQ